MSVRGTPQWVRTHRCIGRLLRTAARSLGSCWARMRTMKTTMEGVRTRGHTAGKHVGTRLAMTLCPDPGLEGLRLQTGSRLQSAGKPAKSVQSCFAARNWHTHWQPHQLALQSQGRKFANWWAGQSRRRWRQHGIGISCYSKCRVGDRHTCHMVLVFLLR